MVLSAQLGYIVPLQNWSLIKRQIISEIVFFKLHFANSGQHNKLQSFKSFYRGSVGSYDNWPGNSDLFNIRRRYNKRNVTCRSWSRRKVAARSCSTCIWCSVCFSCFSNRTTTCNHRNRPLENTQRWNACIFNYLILHYTETQQFPPVAYMSNATFSYITRAKFLQCCPWLLIAICILFKIFALGSIDPKG